MNTLRDMVNEWNATVDRFRTKPGKEVKERKLHITGARLYCEGCEESPPCDRCIKCPRCAGGWWRCRQCSEQWAIETYDRRMVKLEEDKKKAEEEALEKVNRGIDVPELRKTA